MSVKNRINPKDAQLPGVNELLEIIRQQKRPMRLDALMKVCGLKKSCRKDIEKLLFTLKDSGELDRIPGGRWVLPDTLELVTGQFLSQHAGGGVVILDNPPGEIHISPTRTKGAWNKDKVRVLILPDDEGGKIVEILEKQQKELVARVDKCKARFLLCHPLDRKIAVKFNIEVDDPTLCRKRLKAGTLILVKPEKELERDLWQARLLNIFGAENRIGVQENIVKNNHHTPGPFPELAQKQADELDRQPMDFAGREDWRHLPFVTIDGADARDFDDAVHVEKTSHGWILRVAIADVSHYVKPDEVEGSLDAEALKRGNSWYFPTSVEPMLPKILSNGLCSLRPDEDRLAMLAEIAFSKEGDPLNSRFAPIVMRSAGRLTYDAVAKFFEKGESSSLPLHEGESPLSRENARMLEDAYELYHKLAQRRRERGTLDFDLPEPQYKFDENGKLVKMGIAQRNDAHKLIEEFMIAANEAVARFLGTKNIPFLYRVHPEPDAQKLAALYETLDLTGIEHVPQHDRDMASIRPEVIQHILQRAAHTPQEYTVNKLCLRAMQQARYQPVNLGHFGLASKAYCHFTSPIRRYADLMVHRALKKALDLSDEKLPDMEQLSSIGDDLNKLEREAMECEREIARRMGCLALHEHTGQTMKGTISGVTDFGLFVEFDEIPTEGLIRLSDLGSDWYDFDQKRQRLVGQHEGKIWHLGQPVNVKVESVDLDRLEIRLLPEGIKRDFPEKSRKGKFSRKGEQRTGRKQSPPTSAPAGKRRDKARNNKSDSKRHALPGKASCHRPS